MNHLEAALEFFPVEGEAASRLVAALVAAEMYACEKRPPFDALARYLVATEGLKPRCAWEVARYLCDTRSPQLDYIERPAGVLVPWEPSRRAWADPVRQQQEGAA